MATTLVWKEASTNSQEAFVGDATNKAFTLTDSGNGAWVLESHLTGKEHRGGTHGSKEDAKAFADLVLTEENIPQHGTNTPPVNVAPAPAPAPVIVVPAP